MTLRVASEKLSELFSPDERLRWLTPTGSRRLVIFSEPPATGADLNFRAFGVPVRIHPFFWLAAIVTSGALNGPPDLKLILLWTVVFFVSILLHELGHAAAQIYYGGRPWIVLHGFGGLAICGDCDRRPASQIIISLAGPVAGFLLAGLVVSLLFATGYHPTWSLQGPGVLWVGFGYLSFDRIASFWVWFVVIQSLYVNIFWGLVNLLPIYPLDGGRVSRELFTMQGDPRTGIEHSLWVSIAAAGAMAVWGLKQEEWLIVFMFAYLAYTSYQTLQSYSGRGGWR